MSEVRVDTPAAPAAGWYPDPTESGASRWWDGATWTEHVQRATVAAVPADASLSPQSRNLDEQGVPLSLFADSAFDPAVLAPAQGPTSQSDWHNQSGRGVVPKRQAAGSVSLSTGVPTAGSRKHDPYERNWLAGFALVLAIAGIPALGANAMFTLPAVTESIFLGAPLAISLLAVWMSVRRGVGIVVSIVAVVISGAVLAAGLLTPPETIRGLVDAVLALLPA